MGLAATIARRSLLQHPGRTLFSILGVAVGIATVVATFTLDHVTLLSRAPVDPSWRADLEVRARADVPDPRASLASTPGVADVAASFQNEVSVRRAGPELDGSRQLGPARQVLLVALDAGRGPALGAYQVVDGRDLAPTERGDARAAETREVLIGSALLEAGVGVGDTLLLARPLRTARTVCKNGELQELEQSEPPLEVAFTVVGALADEGVGRRGSGEVVVVDYEMGRRMFAGARLEPRFWIKRDATVDVEDLEASLGPRFTYELNQSAVVGQMEDERAFRNGVRMAGLLALILGLYVIFHTLSMSLIERVREVAVLHALGARRRQIGRVFFVEALAIALCAGAVGIALGLGLARLLLLQGITTLGVVPKPVEAFDVPWRLVAPLAGIGVAIALCGSVYPLMRARRADATSALRGEGLGARTALARGFRWFTAIVLVVLLPALYFSIAPAVGATDPRLVGVILAALGVTALLIALPLVVPSIVGGVCGALAERFERRWPLAGRMASRSLAGGASRVASSVAAIALVTAAFVGLKGMTNSLAAEVETWGETAALDRVFVSNLPDANLADLTAALHELPEVVSVESGDARVYAPFLLIGMQVDEMALRGPCKRDPGLAAALRDHGILISERLARHRSLSLGDSLALATSGSGIVEFRVAAITDAYGYFSHPDERIYGVIDAALMHRYFCLDVDSTSLVAVNLRPGPGADPDVVAAAVLGALPPDVDATRVRFEDGADVLAFQLADIRRDFVLFDVILALTALLAAIGVLNGQLLAALERASELGILRALGTSRRQIAGQVLLESCVLGVTGGVIGSLVGSGLTPAVIRALELISGLPLPHRTAGVYLVWCVLGALALTVLAGAYPIWRMNRLDPVRAVRTG
jgi:putative ABC transport system permease protein